MIDLLLTLPLLTGAPAADHIDELIAQGRAELDAGDVNGALEFFDQADAAAEGALRTRVWVLRAHFEKGQQIFDTFDEVDELAKEHEGPELDYLYGMGSYFKAKRFLTDDVTDSQVGFAFEDAKRFLGSAVEAQGERFYDAWYPLMEAAHLTSDLETAGDAAARAVEVRENDPAVWFLAGRVAFSRFLDTKERDEEAATPHLGRAIERFHGALDRVKDPRKNASMVAKIHKELGVALDHQGEKEAARNAYATAIGWDPNVLEYQTYWNSLGLEGFIEVLEQGARQYADRYGADEAGDATLLWWLGSAYYTAERYADSEQAFEQAVEKWPAYTNSWWYIGLSRYQQQDYDGAIAAWHENWKASRTDLVASIDANPELNLEILSYVIGKCAEKGQPPGRQGEYNVKAAFLCQVRCAADGSNWEYWDNYGLFARDGGAFLWQRDSKPEDRETAQELFEKAWKAYQRAIELAPDKPHLRNDGAVILHYYLERDYDTALEMYEQARDMAQEQLEAGGLSEEDRALAETALRDAKNNLEALRKKIEEEEGGGD